MDLIDLEDDQIDAEVLNSLAVTMDNFRVSVLVLTLYVNILLNLKEIVMNISLQHSLLGSVKLVFHLNCEKA